MEKLTMTAKEAAEALQVSRPVIYELCKRPDFPVVHIGRKVLIPRDKLRAWVNAQSGEGAAV